METLALEITRALQFFFTSTSYNQVDQIVLAGGCAAAARAGRAGRRSAAGVGTIVANPFGSMQSSERIRPRQLAQDAPMLLIATGLAHAELRIMADRPHQPAAAPRAEARRRASGNSFRWRSLSVLGRLAAVGIGSRRPRVADRQPAKPQHAPQDGDREARRADQGNRPAARADPGGAVAQAGRRDAAGEPQRSGAPARTSWCASFRTASTCGRSSRPATRSRSTGYAQSNARVSTLMRNIEASPWVGQPELVEIQLVPSPVRPPPAPRCRSSR